MSKYTPFDLDIIVEATSPEIDGTTYTETLNMACTMPFVPSPGMSFMTGAGPSAWTPITEVQLTPDSFTTVRLKTIEVISEKELEQLVEKMLQLGWKL